MSFVFLIPILAYASFLSDILQKTASDTQAATVLALNSQTVPLLAPAINIDPEPRLGADIAMAGGEALLPQSNPSSSLDSESRPATSQISIYVVRQGDTLSGIATMFGVTPNTIVGANSIKGGVIHPGDELIILPITGIEHTVQKGETLASLAKKYNSDATDIALYNNLSSTDTLAAGQMIVIPNGEAAATTPTTASASAVASAKSSSANSASSSKTKPKVAKKASVFVPATLRGVGGPDLVGYYAWPVGGGIITQSLHGFDAVDIGAPTGTSIYAAAAGTVIIAKFDGAWNGGYGNYIVIQHENGTQTLYAHASKILVSAGDSVGQGDLIAKVGSTGESTGPHLHFEVRGAKNPFGDLPLGGSGD